MTLWELIQKSLYHNTAMGNFCDGTSRKHAPSACAKCQLEQWAKVADNDIQSDLDELSSSKKAIDRGYRMALGAFSEYLGVPPEELK